MQRDFGDEVLIAIVAVGVIALAVVFGVILSVVSPGGSADEPTVIAAVSTDATLQASVTAAVEVTITAVRVTQVPPVTPLSPEPESTVVTATAEPTETPAPATFTSSPDGGGTEAATSTEEATGEPTSARTPRSTATEAESTEQRIVHTATDRPTSTLTATREPSDTPTTAASPTRAATFTDEPTATRKPSATATPEPTDTATTAAVASDTATRAPTATRTPSITPIATLEPTDTEAPTIPPSPTASRTATDTPKPTATATVTASPSPAPTDTLTATATATPSATATDTPTATVTSSSTPTPSATATDTLVPTATATPFVLGQFDDDGRCLLPPEHVYVPYSSGVLGAISERVGDDEAAYTLIASCAETPEDLTAGDVLAVKPETFEDAGLEKLLAPGMVGCEVPMIVTIAAPVPNTSFTEPFRVIGTAFSARIESYVIEMRADTAPVPVIEEHFSVPVVLSVLGVIEPSALEPGLYWLRVVVNEQDAEKPTAACAVRIGIE
ncbi:MAG: hypothetical protein BroJett007_06640 [Chloroflexota bacterium]|nr:MAG: hypothetical protein BroJett007_06640 [Chloroflexota bacterium]